MPPTPTSLLPGGSLIISCGTGAAQRRATSEQKWHSHPVRRGDEYQQCHASWALLSFRVPAYAGAGWGGRGLGLILHTLGSKEYASCVCFMLQQQWGPPQHSSNVTHCYHRGRGREGKKKKSLYCEEILSQNGQRKSEADFWDLVYMKVDI